MEYLVIYRPPSSHWTLSDLMKELFAKTGARLYESRLFSVQPECFKGVDVRPLTVILCDTFDRYGIIPSLNEASQIEIIEAKDLSDALRYSEGLRPTERTIKYDDGKEQLVTEWAKP